MGEFHAAPIRDVRARVIRVGGDSSLFVGKDKEHNRAHYHTCIGIPMTSAVRRDVRYLDVF